MMRTLCIQLLLYVLIVLILTGCAQSFSYQNGHYLQIIESNKLRNESFTQITMPSKEDCKEAVRVFNILKQLNTSVDYVVKLICADEASSSDMPYKSILFDNATQKVLIVESNSYSECNKYSSDYPESKTLKECNTLRMYTKDEILADDNLFFIESYPSLLVQIDKYNLYQKNISSENRLFYYRGEKPDVIISLEILNKDKDISERDAFLDYTIVISENNVVLAKQIFKEYIYFDKEQNNSIAYIGSLSNNRYMVIKYNEKSTFVKEYKNAFAKMDHTDFTLSWNKNKIEKNYIIDEDITKDIKSLRNRFNNNVYIDNR